MKQNGFKIPGKWRDGYAMDLHTISSTFLGEDEFGHPIFDQKRSELGDLLYQLKYRSDPQVIPAIVEAVVSFINNWKPQVDLLVPVPPSRPRKSQPVLALAEKIAERLNLPYEPSCVVKSRTIPELKNVYPYNERIRLLESAYTIDRKRAEGQRVLLFDDLFRSGATLNAITAALYDQGHAKDVFALAITKTRKNQ